MFDPIEAAAQAAVNAHTAAEEAVKNLTERTAERDRLRGRIDALKAERSGIVAERASGQDDPAHGQRLQLIAADIEGLEELIRPIEADAVKAQTAAQQARSSAAIADQNVARVTDEELLSRLVAHARSLDELLLKTAQDIAGLARQLGRGRNQWQPTPELANELRRLDLTRITGVPR